MLVLLQLTDRQLFIFYMANDLGHPDNSIPANPRVTPHDIVPEW